MYIFYSASFFYLILIIKSVLSLLLHDIILHRCSPLHALLLLKFESLSLPLYSLPSLFLRNLTLFFFFRTSELPFRLLLASSLPLFPNPYSFSSELSNTFSPFLLSLLLKQISSPLIRPGWCFIKLFLKLRTTLRTTGDQFLR